jgi:hypothetical protein
MKEVVQTLNLIELAMMRVGNLNPDPGMIEGYSLDPDHSMVLNLVLS